MKKLVLLVLVVVALASCGKEKKVDTPNVETKKEVVKEEAKKIVKEVVSDGKTAKGKEIFTAKGCVACHQLDKKVVGPSLQDIAKVYTEKKGNMVKFLKGNADAIVDTDPGQVAVMKANITGILKDFSAEELQAVSAYIRSTAK